MRPGSEPPPIVVIGDSHSHYCFSRVRGAQILWVGPVTMHRVARDGLPPLVPPHAAFSHGTILVGVFGEIDVRCHLGRVAHLERKPVRALIADLASRYVLRMREFQGGGGPALRIVCGVVPPLDPLLMNEEYPTFGSLAARVAIRRALNARLEHECRANGVAFMPVPTSYETRHGSMRMSLSDGVAHIASDCAGPMIDALGRAIGRRLGRDTPPLADRLRRAVARRIWRRDAHRMIALGAPPPSRDVAKV